MIRVHLSFQVVLHSNSLLTLLKPQGIEEDDNEVFDGGIDAKSINDRICDEKANKEIQKYRNITVEQELRSSQQKP